MGETTRAPRVGTTYRPRLRGEEREAKGRELAQGYVAGATIRALMDETGMSYGTVRALLLEAGVKLRSRGGRAPKGGGDPCRT